MKMSFPSWFESKYASRISEYVIPPATNRSNRWRVSVTALVVLAARCQLGFALRSEVVGVGVGRALNAAGVD
jgi:hypothetical protein